MVDVKRDDLIQAIEDTITQAASFYEDSTRGEILLGATIDKDNDCVIDLPIIILPDVGREKFSSNSDTIELHGEMWFDPLDLLENIPGLLEVEINNDQALKKEFMDKLKANDMIVDDNYMGGYLEEFQEYYPQKWQEYIERWRQEILENYISDVVPNVLDGAEELGFTLVD